MIRRYGPRLAVVFAITHLAIRIAWPLDTLTVPPISLPFWASATVSVAVALWWLGFGIVIMIKGVD